MPRKKPTNPIPWQAAKAKPSSAPSLAVMVEVREDHFHKGQSRAELNWPDYLNFKKKLCRHTWAQAKASHGFDYKERSCPPNRFNWPKSVSPDAICIQMRTGSKGRVYGFIVEDIFQTVWIDPDHKWNDH